MAANQFQSALRFLARNKGYTTINVLGLTFGLCACLVIYNIVSYEFSFDRSHPHRDRIYRLGSSMKLDNGNGVITETYGRFIPAPAPEAILAEVPLVETLAAYYTYNVGITIPASNEHLHPNEATIIAGKEYFDIFPYTWLAGSAAQALTQPYSVVLTESRARQYFGDMPPDQYMNRELIYDDSLHVHVSGIIGDFEGNTDFRYTDFISFPTISHSFLKQTYTKDRWSFNLGSPGIQAFAKLRKDANVRRSAAQVDAILQRNIVNDPFLRAFKLSMILQPLDDVHFNAAFDHDGIRKANKPTLYGLIGIAAFILLLAIGNFINLSTAQSMKRAKDIGMRRILGATRFMLISRSLTETATLITISAIIALALMLPVMSIFGNYLPETLPFNPFSLGYLLFTVGIIILTTLLAGLYPAINLVQGQFNRTVRTQITEKFTLRRILIVFQFSISLLFIIASIVVGRQIRYMLNADMGFNSSAVVTVNGLDASPQQLQLFARQALGIPGVQGATIQNHSPASTNMALNPMYIDNRTDNKLDVFIQDADQQFIPLYHMRLLAGHNLSFGDSLREFVINDTYRKALGFAKPEDALGHTITWRDEIHPIVGVVSDFHTTTLHTSIPAVVIARVARMDNSIGLRITPGNPQVVARVEALWKNIVPDQPFNYTFLDDSIAKLYKQDQQMSWLVRISTGVTIFVSCMGLLGLILFIVERKKKEISIRKVLGAGVGDIVFLLNKEFMVLVGIALLIASPVAFLGMHRWLQGFAYRINISWWIFLLAGMVILAISILTTSLRVIRAALVNPTDNLRSE